MDMEKLKEKATIWLKWSEKYTKTDMVYLAKGGFWNILSQVVVSASTLLLAIAFARFVSKEAYGQYKYILSIASILSTFTLTGLSGAVLQSVNRGYEGTLSYTFWKNIKWSILYFLISLGVSIYYFVHGNTSIGFSMLIIGSLTPFLNSTNLYASYLEAKKDFRRSAIYFNMIGNVFPSVCLFVAMFFTNKPIWFVTVYFISNTLIGVILYFRVVGIYKPNNKIDEGSMSYGKHLSLMGVIGGVIGNLDQILTFHYLGAAELAIYNFAVAIPSQIKGPMKGLASLVLPKFVERDDKDIRSGMINKLVILFLVAVFMIIVYIVAAPYIYHIFFPKYADSIFYSQVFSLSLLWIISIPTDAYLMAKKKIKEQYVYNIVSSTSYGVLLCIGIWWWGLLGLIAARVLNNIITVCISIFLYEKSSRV